MKDGSCIIVGGAGGMGVQICRKLLENEITNLAIVDIQPEPHELLDNLKAHQPKSRIVYYKCDVAIKDEIDATFNEINDLFPTIDILINAAGIFNDKNIELTFKVNVFGLIYSTMLGVELMQKRKGHFSNGPVILNIASLVGLDPFHLMPIYTASKHSIVGFSRAFSHETFYNCNGVKIIVLCPGATMTSFVRQFSGNMVSCIDEAEALKAFQNVPKQSSREVAEHAVELIKSAENGSIWISDNGQLRQIDMTTYCSAFDFLTPLSE